MGSTTDLATFARRDCYALDWLTFMRPAGPSMPVTEAYVAVPPALQIRDNEGATWTLGFDYSHAAWLSGKWEFDVVRNGRVTGEFARTIEYRRGQIIIFGSEGRRVFNGKQFV